MSKSLMERWREQPPMIVEKRKISNRDEDTDKGCGVIIVKDGLFLVGTRVDNGQVCSGGGHLKAGEKPEEGAYRENLEEFGVEAINLLPLNEKSIYDGSEEFPAMSLCTEFNGEPKCDGKEMRDARWVSFDELMKADLYEPFADAVLALLTNIMETLKSDDETELDGSSSSGDKGHKGWLGHKGGSLPAWMRGTSDGYDKSIRRYLKMKKLDELKECLEMIPEGAIIKHNGVEYVKHGSLFDTKVGSFTHSFYPKDLAIELSDNKKKYEGVIFKEGSAVVPPTEKPKRQSDIILETKNFDELEKVVNENGAVFEDSYEYGNVREKAHFETYKKFVAGIYSFADEFPLSRKWLKKLAVYPAGVACSYGYGSTIAINPRYFKENKDGVIAVQKICDDSDKDWSEGKIGWWNKNIVIGAVGAHELAHGICHKIAHYSGETYGDFCWSIVRDSLSAIKKTAYGIGSDGKKKSNEELRKAISGYAYGGKDTGETIAEAMSDCYTNNENANPLSIEIKKRLKQKYDSVFSYDVLMDESKKFYDEHEYLWEV